MTPLRILIVSLFGVLASVAHAAPAPYSLPWQLRPTAAVNVVRSDTSMGFSNVAGASRTTTASMLLASYKVTPAFSPMIRLGIVSNSQKPAPNGGGLLNPVLGGTYSVPFGDSFRMGLFLGATIPIGAGGGNKPEAPTVAALRAGILTRSAVDNAMFATNDFTVFPGVGVSFSRAGFTAQVEATVLRLIRVRGEVVQRDANRTNFTTGLHLGYFILPQLSVGGDLRYQRWLSTPVAVVAAPDARDNLTAAIGLRTHWKIGQTFWLRPGLSYGRGLDKPMTDQKFSIVQLDVPFLF